MLQGVVQLSEEKGGASNWHRFCETVTMNSISKLVLATTLCVCSASAVWAVDADNSANNVQDKSQTAITPAKQSNAQPDLDVTKAIRRAITKDSSLSVYAHNIKIITTQEHTIYLRGTVSSQDDLQKIVSLAKSNSNGYPVENQLSVTK